jgi:hypothetical protein
MSNPFDPYREALVVETSTVWPAELARIGPAEQARLEERLHADPRQATQLAYIRLHTGFCREITVGEEDMRRLGQ